MIGRKEDMNEQLNNALADVIKAGKDGVINMALFAQQQAPDLAKQIVSWGFWSNFSECFIEIFVIFLCFKGFIWTKKAIAYDTGNPFPYVFWVVGGILATIMFVCFCNSVEACIQCLVAPKLYLIDYVKKLVIK
jgi:hypothetical protein